MTAVLVVAVSTTMAAPAGAGAVPTLALAQGVSADGTPTFEAGAPSPDQPGGAGNDASDHNGIVRTFDDVTYWVDWAVNDADADVTVTVAASAGTTWQRVPASCRPDSDLLGATLVCHLGARPAGTSGRINPVLHVGGVHNLDTVSVTSTVTAAGATPATAAPSTVTASAAPKFDLFGQRSVGGAYEQVPFSTNAVDPSGRPGRVFYYPVSVEVGGSGKGGEPAAGDDFSFDMDLSALPASATLVSGSSTFSGSVPSTTMVSWACGPAALAAPGVVFGHPGIVPAATTRTSTDDSGAWDCSQSGTTVSVDVTGANLAPASTPIYDSTGLGLATDRQVLVSGEVGIWVSDVDLQAISGDPGSGSLRPTVLSWVHAPVGVSGAAGTGEVASTDATSVSFRFEQGDGGDNHYVNGDLTWVAADTGGGSFKILNPGFQHPVIPWYRPYVPTQTQQDNVGDGTVVAGQIVGLTTVVSNTRAGNQYLGVCSLIPTGQHLSTWDTARIADFEPVGSQTALVNMTAPIITEVQPGDLPGFDLHSVVTMNQMSESGNMADPPELAAGSYRVEYSTADDASCATGPWTSTLPPDLTSVKRVRAFTTTPVGAMFNLGLVLPVSIDPAPTGSRVESAGVSGIIGDPGGTFDPAWFDDPATWTRDLQTPDHARGQCDVYGHGPDVSRNDCLWVASSILGLTKTVTSPQTNALSAGDIVRYELTATANGGAGGEVTDLTITDDLPAGLEYLGDATPAPTSATGGHLVWNLGTAGNGTARSITYSARVAADGFTPDSYLFNQATATGSSNGSALTPAAAQALVVTGGSSRRLDLTKSTATPLIDPNADDGSYDVHYANAGGSTLGDLDLIDVLPWRGDHRSPATDYTGTAALRSVDITDGATVGIEYTAASPSSINRDPADPSNAAGGGTTWCTATDFGTSGCPIDLGHATGLRLHRTGPLAPGASGTIRVGLTTDGNRAGDVYTNDASARVDGITLLVRSADVPITVRGIDLSVVTTSATSGPVLVGSTVTFTVTVRNDGPDTATGVVLHDPVPAGLRYTSASDSGALVGSDVEWAIGDLAAGESRTVTVTFMTTKAGMTESCAQVAAADQVDRDSSPGTGPLAAAVEDDESCAPVTAVVAADVASVASAAAPATTTTIAADTVTSTTVTSSTAPLLVRWNLNEAPRSSPGDHLAVTGGNALVLAATAAASIAAGLVLLARHRRRFLRG